MGYIGFGMRKEVYTRKPKRAFEKIKQYNGDNIVVSKLQQIRIATEDQLRRARIKAKEAQWNDDLRNMRILGVSVAGGLLVVYGLVWWFIL